MYFMKLSAVKCISLYLYGLYDSMYFMNVFGNKMYFLVPVWADLIRVLADLIRVLAHACAWENRTVTSL